MDIKRRIRQLANRIKRKQARISGLKSMIGRPVGKATNDKDKTLYVQTDRYDLSKDFTEQVKQYESEIESLREKLAAVKASA